MFSEEDSRRQDAQFEEIKAEFSRLVEQEEQIRKTMGNQEPVSEAEMTPEMHEAVQIVKERAAREGAARAAQFKNGTSARSAGASPLPGKHRQGIVRI